MDGDQPTQSMEEAFQALTLLPTTRQEDGHGHCEEKAEEPVVKLGKNRLCYLAAIPDKAYRALKGSDVVDFFRRVQTLQGRQLNRLMRSYGSRSLVTSGETSSMKPQGCEAEDTRLPATTALPSRSSPFEPSWMRGMELYMKDLASLRLQATIILTYDIEMQASHQLRCSTRTRAAVSYDESKPDSIVKHDTEKETPRRSKRIREVSYDTESEADSDDDDDTDSEEDSDDE